MVRKSNFAAIKREILSHDKHQSQPAKLAQRWLAVQSGLFKSDLRNTTVLPTLMEHIKRAFEQLSFWNMAADIILPVFKGASEGA